MMALNFLIFLIVAYRFNHSKAAPTDENQVDPNSLVHEPEVHQGSDVASASSSPPMNGESATGVTEFGIHAPIANHQEQQFNLISGTHVHEKHNSISV
jgi:hypothetical protein